MMARGRPRSISEALAPREAAVAAHLVDRIRRDVPAVLLEACLFGSRARGDARPDSDIDILLVFRRLPWDREPQASMAEEIADRLAVRAGVPVAVWSVSMPDLEPGARTPMLVDAIHDAIPLWCPSRPIPPLRFTPADAVRCTGALLDRVEEGEAELEHYLSAGDLGGAAMRIRDDLVRMCTALELLRGRTRARRGELALRVMRADARHLAPATRRALAWAASSYGRDGRDTEAPVGLPPSPDAAIRAVGDLRRLVRRRRAELARHGGHPTCTDGRYEVPPLYRPIPGRTR